MNVMTETYSYIDDESIYIILFIYLYITADISPAGYPGQVPKCIAQKNIATRLFT